MKVVPPPRTIAYGRPSQPIIRQLFDNKSISDTPEPQPQPTSTGGNIPISVKEGTTSTTTSLPPINELSPEQRTMLKELNLEGIYTTSQQTNNPKLFQLAYSAKLRSLHFNPTTGEPLWSEIPPEQRKYYPGASEYFSSLSNDERIRAIGVQNINKGIKDYQSIQNINPTYKQRVFKMAQTLETKYGKMPENDLLTQAVTNVLWEDYTNPNAKADYYASLDPITRTATTFIQNARQSAVGIITFPLTVAEFVGSQIQGKPWGVPVLSPLKQRYETWEATQTIGPSGLISRGTSEATSRLGITSPEERAYIQSQQEKYPVETIFATGGEVAGLYTGGAVYGIAKTGISKTFTFATTKLGKPLVLSAFSPPTALRTIYYKSKSTIKEVPAETKLSSSVTEAGTKYGQIPYNLGIQKFIKTKGALRTNEYTVVHASPSPISTSKSFKVGGSTSESPGISTSPYGEAVPQFFGLEPSFSTKYSLSIFPKSKRPTLTTFQAKEIVHLPEKSQSFTSSASLMKTQPKGQYAVIAPKMELGSAGLVEPEAIIWKGTTGKVISTPEFIMYKGVAIPEVRTVLQNAPIKPEWEIGTIFPKQSSSYTPYLISSHDIIREFRTTSKSNAKSLFNASAKFEIETKGTFQNSWKTYTSELKKIERIAKEKEFKLQEYQKPTTFGQLKLKGFKSIEGSKRNLSKTFTERPGTSSIPISTSSIKILTSKYYKSPSTPYKSIPKISPSKSLYKSYPSYTSYRETSEPSRPSRPSYPTYPSYPSKPSIKLPLLPFIPTTSHRYGDTLSFDVYIRKNNRWIKKNDVPLDKETALGLGAHTSTTFKIKPRKSGSPQRIMFYSSFWLQNKTKYYLSNGVYRKK